MTQDIAQILAGLFRDYMGIPQDRVYIYNQKLNIPKDEGLYVVVFLQGEKPYATNYRTALGECVNGCWREVPPEFVQNLPQYRSGGVLGSSTPPPTAPVLTTLPLVEVVTINSQERYKVRVGSYGPDAYKARHMPILALGSTLSQKLQESYGFTIAAMPTVMNDVSALDETGMLTLYEVSFMVLTSSQEIKPIDSIDSFTIPPTIAAQP